MKNDYFIISELADSHANHMTLYYYKYDFGMIFNSGKVCTFLLSFLDSQSGMELAD